MLDAPKLTLTIKAHNTHHSKKHGHGGGSNDHTIAQDGKASNLVTEHVVLKDKSIDLLIKDLIGDDKIVRGSRRELTAMKVQKLLQEEGKVIAGSGHINPIGDINRIITQYGGVVDDWSKMSSRQINKSIEIHWYENIQTGQKIELKVKQ